MRRMSDFKNSITPLELRFLGIFLLGSRVPDAWRSSVTVSIHTKFSFCLSFAWETTSFGFNMAVSFWLRRSERSLVTSPYETVFPILSSHVSSIPILPFYTSSECALIPSDQDPIVFSFSVPFRSRFVLCCLDPRSFSGKRLSSERHKHGFYRDFNI
jgi:hypothetical protein